MRRLIIPLMVLALAVGCGRKSPTEPSGEFLFTTDQRAYAVGDTVTLTAINGFDHSVFVGSCPGPITEKEIDGAWVVQEEFVPLCFAEYFLPVEIVAGERITSKRWREFLEPGTYRFRHGIWERSVEDPLRQVYSKSFRVE